MWPKKYRLTDLIGCLVMLILWAIPAQAGMGGDMGSAAGSSESGGGNKMQPAELKDVLWDKTKEGQVRIFVQPAAFLHIDGKMQQDAKGKMRPSEKFVAALTAGEHVIKMSMDGYQPSEKKITIEAGKPYSLNFTLLKEGQKQGEMVLIPAGDFWMGIDKDDLNFIVQKIGGEERFHLNESPRRKVNVPAFYVDKYEITNQEYKKFLEASKGKEAPDGWENGTYPSGKGLHPVTSVTWNDAEAYCKWAGKRLPTETEWEKAARWGPDNNDSTLFPWGNNFHRLKANTADGGPGKTTIVGQYEEGKSAYGVYDMTGNAKEWVEDWYADYPGAKFQDIFTAEDKVKVARGGSFMERNYDSLATCRFKISPGSFAEDLGFRCAKDAK